ncbi:MAG: hypothetical protein GOV01_03500 [Candidatus Altiarchaeota archaeon]|nr:hypothetical protein [Candidatus Altiarchaeota archaeon]
MLSAIAMAISTTIGAGVLGLPKALYLMGPWGALLGALVAFFLIVSAMMLSDMLAREKKPVQLPTLISDILGKKWKYFVYLTLIFSMYGALSAYLLGFGSQLNTLIGTPHVFGGLILFLIGGFVVFKGTKVIEKIDLPLAFALVGFLIFLSFMNIKNFNGFTFNTPELPDTLRFTGTMLFALFGLNVLPEINFISKGRAVKVFIISTLLSLFLYLGFAFTTVGVLGSATTGLGTQGLAVHYGGFYNIIISFFTMIALLTSFLGIGLSLFHVYQFDFKLSRILSILAVILPPLGIFLYSGSLGFGFLDILGLAGELTLPLFALTMVYAYYKVLPAIKPKTPFPRLAIFFTALFYALVFGFSVYELFLV